MAVLGIMVVGGLMYGWHKVKETAKSKGIDLNDLTETHHESGRRLDACALLTKEELSQITGIHIERTEGGGKSAHSRCTYFSSDAPEKAADAATEAIKHLQESGSTGNAQADQEKAIKEVGAITRAMASTGAKGMVTSIEVQTEDAKSAMAAFKIAMGLMTAGMEKNNALREDIKGLGDEAIMGPLASMFMFRKGDVAVSIDGRGLTGGRDVEIAIAKNIAGKI
jgi:hypothetical protein